MKEQKKRSSKTIDIVSYVNGVIRVFVAYFGSSGTI